MSDLIERLREMAGPSLCEGDSDTARGAATEIERLRDHVEAQQAEIIALKAWVYKAFREGWLAASGSLVTHPLHWDESAARKFLEQRR